jgi:Holliday junction resolvasome RuvABC endonuclease subunit
LRVLALDLSSTATGWALLAPDYHSPLDHLPREVPHGTIKTPGSRRKGEDEWSWYARRSTQFRGELQAIVLQHKPDVVVIEVSKKVFSRKDEEATSGRYGAGAQYRAGQMLGRAMGWVDAAIGMQCQIVSSSVEVAKKAITGNGQATKDVVREFLERIYGWKLTGWTKDEVDALSIAVAHLQNQQNDARDRARALVADIKRDAVIPMRPRASARRRAPRRSPRPTT